MLAAPLGMCQTTSQVNISEYCQIANPIKASRKDTDGTLRQIARENAKFREFCAIRPE